MRLDTGNTSGLVLLKKTTDFLEIKQKFRPHLDPHGPISYGVPVTLIGAEENITVQAQTFLAEDIQALIMIFYQLGYS